MSDDRRARLAALEERLGHHFAEPSLLDQALTHSSLANERPAGEVPHNEPLEFLGDAVLGLLVADLLHRRDPRGPEGPKSKARAQLVSARSLARRAEALGLPALLTMGRGEEKTGGRAKAALWADAYEAVIAAVYLDGGFAAAQAFVVAEFAARPRARGPRRPRLQERSPGASPGPGRGAADLRRGRRGGPEPPPALSRAVPHRRPGGGGGGGIVEEGRAAGGGAERRSRACGSGRPGGYSIQPPPRHTSPS